jgi:acetoin utilization deacetylase AcuC-like enzyme
MNLIWRPIGTTFLVLWAAIPFQGTSGQVPQKSTVILSSQTGLGFDTIYLRHLAGNTGHPERPERLTAIMDGLEKAELLKSLYRIVPRRATEEELALVHGPSYLALVQRELSNLQGLHELSTGDTLTSPDSFEVAHYAVGGVLEAVDAVMANRVKNAFCAVRPPGHHASRDRGMGFCIYNNVAIAARYPFRRSTKSGAY